MFSKKNRLRFRSMIRVIDQNCWEWMGPCHPKGYGRFYAEGLAIYSHRWTYMLKYGPIPDGLEIHHLCRNRSCCNPDHLIAVTHQENMKLAGRAGAWSGEKNPQSRRSDNEIMQLKILHHTGMPAKLLAEIFNMPLRSVYYAIVEGWKHLSITHGTERKAA